MKSAAEWGISLLLFFVSLFLTVTSYLYYIDKQDMSWHKDQTLLLIILSVLFLIGLRLLSKWISHRKNPTRTNHILFWSVFTIIMGFSVWWIANARSLAQSDAASLHQMALSIIRKGDYSMIAPKGSYLSLWPFQTGLLLYYEGILRLIPDYNVVPMQILNWGYLGAGLISAYFLVRKWFHDEKVTACFSVLLLFCWPWFFYVNFAYGEIPSISAMLVVAWMMTLYLEHKKKRFLGIVLITLGFGVMLRKNLSIFVVASVLILLVSMLQRYRKQYLFAIAGMIAVTILANMLPTKVYELRANNRLGKGVTAYNYIAMGLQETEGISPGWNNGFHSRVVIDSDYDTALADEISKQSIRKSLTTMLEKPGYACGFFYRKLVPQWCDPNYSCFYSTQLVYHNRTQAAWNIYDGIRTKGILNVMNVYQSVLYLGLLLYSVAVLQEKWIGRRKGVPDESTRREKSEDLWSFVLALALIGGFIFYLFWEGGSRYTLPYMVCILPYAAKGIIKTKIIQ